MSKRIHELAKEWGVQPKDFLAGLEKVGIRGKKSQSSLTDEEVQRVREALGLAPRPTVAIGAQRVVSDRVVTERDAGGEHVVTAREQTTETRLRPNVIRRRTAREVVKTEEVPVAHAEPSLPDIPPSLDTDVPPSLMEVPVEPEPLPPPLEEPPPTAEAEPERAPERPAAAPPEPEPKPAEPAPAPVAAKPAPSAAKPEQAPRRPAPPSAAPRVTVPPRPTAAPAAPSAPPQPPPPGFEQMRSVKVLGKIDLRKPAAPPAPVARPGEAVPSTTEVGPDGQPRKKKGRKVIKKSDMLDVMERDFQRTGKRPQKRRALPGKEQKKTEITVPRASKRVIRISEVVTVADLARAMGVKAGEVLKKLLDMGMMATINQSLDHDTAALVAAEFEYQVENVAIDVEQMLETEQEAAGEEARTTRAPVVTMMGHVDHGKTSLLDAIRATNVAAGEAGGITQHIGAYTVDVNGRQVTFLDTPGHEAFTAMRARGANVTDIVVLVVAADDGIMPQTVEAISHARAAGVPIIVAINKIDKPDADPERVKQELGNHGLAPEEWGGDTIVVPVSAKTKEGIPQLLDMLLLQADVLELKANPNRLAKGTIVEARLDRGRGPLATVLVQEGTLKAGDAFVCGTQYGRIRAMVDDKGRRIEAAGPSTPVEILGLGGVPEAGDTFVAVQDDQKARQVAEHRRTKQREGEMAKTAKVSLDDLYQQIQTGEMKELKVVLKADVQGSVEAMSEALRRLSTEDVRLTVVLGAVGGITESDVRLASASNAIVIGFNVRPEPKAAALAEREGVDIRLYTVIYEALNDVRDALEGLLEPTLQEKVLGRAEVRQVFTVSGVGTVAGCFVSDGKILRGAKARLLRDNVVAHDGRIGTLKRFKDDVREVASGYECGMSLEGYQDVKQGDVIEAYEVEQVARRLAPMATRGAQAAERSA
ncbi:MAG TPA: translation initiation factor IF-2 [Candidatus Binatia bacterium]|jgi:translation initiation factor IF-2|nr:translation initiation factor IF-2 [Candidatus Binatia bacterium]